MLMRIEMHVCATVERVQPTEQGLQWVGLQEWVIFRHVLHDDGKLVICGNGNEG